MNATLDHIAMAILLVLVLYLHRQERHEHGISDQEWRELSSWPQRRDRW